MQLEALAVTFSIGALVIAVGALAARDHTTPLIDLIRQNAGFVLAAFFVPFVLLQVISPTLAQPWRGAAVGGTIFAWASLSVAYLKRDPTRARLNARNALIGAVVFAAGVVFGNGWTY